MATKKTADPCEKCGLYRTCKSPKMDVTGEGRRRILVLAEASGKTEDERGIQLIGQSGQLLRQTLSKFGVDLERDCWKTNALRCRPPDNRKPHLREIRYCKKAYLEQDLRRLRPRKILLLGTTAVTSFLDQRMDDIGAITRWLGWAIPDQDYRAWVFACYHPAYVLRDGKNVALRIHFEEILQKALEWDRPLPDYRRVKDCVTLVGTPEEAVQVLRQLPPQIAFDYETTGIKPYGDGHKIVAASVCGDDNRAYVFPFFDDAEFRAEWQRVLAGDGFTEKIAHNLKFEAVWTRECLGYDVRNWVWDTMVCAHVLDNRQKITGLKFQAYARFGLLGYDDEIKKYIRAGDGSDHNSIDEAPQWALLLYCGLDSLLTWRLYGMQREEITPFRRQGLDLLLKGLPELAEIERTGVGINCGYYESKIAELTREYERLQIEVQTHADVRRYMLRYEKFNPDSPKQLQQFFFKFLHLPVNKLTAGGGASTDVEVLQGLEHEVADLILGMRKITKLRDTYLANLLRQDRGNGIIHPQYWLHTARTYRSSSSDPNFQNIPRRDKTANAVVRGGIVPGPGNMLVEADFSGIEVAVAACYVRDPALIRYVSDPDTNMHRDVAMELFFLDQEEVTKEIRNIAKNGFVFPEFYGDYFRPCAANMWKQMRGVQLGDSTHVVEHLRDHGISGPDGFERHVQDIEEDFWGRRFRVYAQWKRRVWEKYLRLGYLTSHTGFVYASYMKKNDATNYAIQGSAFHCLLWSLCEVAARLRRRGLKSRIVMEIHDSLVLDVVPQELDEVVALLQQVMCVDLCRAWSWLIVPLRIEIEVTARDGNWAEKKKLEIRT